MPGYWISTSSNILDKTFWPNSHWNSCCRRTNIDHSTSQEEGCRNIHCAPLQMSCMGTSNAMIPLIINKVPQFTVRPPKKIKRYLGQSVTLNYSADGHPVPIITWSRCKGHITEGRTQLMESGQLKINSLTAEDSYPYTCRAQSELVHVETEVKVVVKTGEKSFTVRGPHKSVLMSPR